MINEEQIFIRDCYENTGVELLDYSIFRPLVPFIVQLDSDGFIELNLPPNLVIDIDKMISYIPDCRIEFSHKKNMPFRVISGHMDKGLINILNQMYIDSKFQQIR